MNFLIEKMNGSLGIPINMINDGTSGKSRPSTYMDQVTSGWKDAWIVLTFYTALQNMIELETVVGNVEMKTLYQSLVNNYDQLFDETFWNKTTGRYIGWIDKNGNKHDSGHVFTVSKH